MVRSTKRSLIAKEANLNPAKLRRISSTGNTKTIPDNIFQKLIAASGVVLSFNDENNVLDKDQVLFQSTFAKEYKKASAKKEIRDDFIEGFLQHIEDDMRFKMCLLPTTTSESCSISYRGEQQESIIRILLGVPFIQASLGRCLLDKLYKDVANKNETFTSVFHGLDVPCLVVSQFRWLDKIEDSKALTDKMFELVIKSQPSLQKELISCVPDLVEDSRHQDISLQLKSLLEKNLSLSSCILESIGNLNLKGETLRSMQSSVLSLLETAKSSDLSTLIKFILQSITDADACQILTELRECLSGYDFEPVSYSTPAVASTRRKSIDSNSFDVIKSGLLFNASVSNGWMKSIEKLKDKSSLKSLDLFALLTLQSKVTTSKQAMTLLRAKIKSQCLSEDIIHIAFKSHTEVFSQLRTSILSVCETLLRSPELPITSFGALLYTGMFTMMDSECQQAVITTLVAHITSGVSIEIESAFSVLNDLVELNPNQMVLFGSQLKGLLDSIDILNMQQIRSLFTMLGTLGSLETSDSTMEDLMVYLRKQLSSNQQKSKRIGITGTSILIGCSSTKRNTETPQTNDPIESQSLDLLKMLQKGTERQSDSAALFYDELSQIIHNGNVNSTVLEWVAETMMAHFQEKFTIDCETIQQSENSQVNLCFDIDESTEEAIAIDIAPILLKELESNAATSSSRLIVHHKLASLAPQFRLVQTCEKKQSGDLSGICALLGCPIALFNEATLEAFSRSNKSIKDTICLSLVYTISWLQELINAFASSSDKEIQSKVLKRLSNIQLLSRQLAQCLINHASFKMPQFQFDIAANKCVSPKAPLEKKKNDSKSGKKKKTASSKNNDVTCLDADQIACDETAEDDIIDDIPDEKQISQSITSLKNCLRELDVSVFDVFNYRNVVKSIRDESLFDEDITASSIILPTIIYLVEDLCSKVQFKLPSTTSGRKTFFKPKSDKSIGFARLATKDPVEFVNDIVKYLPLLLLLLKSAIAKFQSVIDQNNGIMDGKGMFEDGVKFASLLHRKILEIFHTLLHWNGFHNSNNEDLLDSVLSCLTPQRSEVSDQVSSTAKLAMKYLTSMKSTCPSSNSAKLIMQILIKCGLINGDGNHAELNSLCKEFLCRDWLTPSGDKEKGAAFNSTIASWIQTYIQSSEDIVSTIDTVLVGPVKTFIENKSSDDNLEWRTVNKNTFPACYRSISEELVSWLRTVLTRNQKSMDHFELLVKLNDGVKCFHMLISLVRVVDGKVVLGYALKNGKLFLELFVKHAMPILDKQLKKNKEIVASILKNLQQSTRNLNHFCGHLKTVRDSSLTSHVPPIKKLLEMFVFRVKTMLAFNNCDDAFWLGNLKNRDIRGNEIHSQMTQRESDEDEDEEEDEVEAAGEDDNNDENVTVAKENETNDVIDDVDDDHADSYSTCY